MSLYETCSVAQVLTDTTQTGKALVRGRTDRVVTYLLFTLQVCFSGDRALLSGLSHRFPSVIFPAANFEL